MKLTHKVSTATLMCALLFSYNSYANQNCSKQQILTAKSCVGDGIDEEENRLYKLINDYRLQYNLPKIPISPSLSLVANRHVRDLDGNVGYLTHGWSNCPYSSNNKNTYNCMWKAPQRLGTSYLGYGYENAHGGSGGYVATAQSSFNSWLNSSSHHAVIINQGIWKNRQWKALGIGLYKGYAVIWFGDQPDSNTTNSPSLNKMADTVFNYIEIRYAKWFSPHKNSQTNGEYYYRFYGNKTYLLMWKGDLWYNLGTGWKKAGRISDWYHSIKNK